MPNDEVLFLSVDEVLVIHDRVIEAFGGAAGIRDLGLLESALHRPQSGYYDDLETMAAALFESLLINHSFIDGNKRVAFFATDVFLRLNGWRLNVDASEAHEFILSLFGEERFSVEDLAKWVRRSATKLDG